MDVNQFLSTLTNLEKTRNFNVFKEYSLAGFQSALNYLDINPPKKETLRISVVGTNGKGSTAFFLSQIFLQLQKFSPVGLYTSPHLITQNERIQVNGSFISDEWMNEKLNSFSPEKIEILKTLSYFEFFTAFSILFFEDNNCKTEIYEAGLGGRLDATKLVNPDIVVLTKIALDHTEILGDSIEKILIEKLNIVGTNTKFLFSFLQEESLIKITESFCKEREIEFILFPYSVSNDYLSFNKNFALFITNFILEKNNEVPIEKKIFDVIPNMNGRMQIIRKSPTLLFDIGHNPSSLLYLLQSIEFSYPNETNWDVYVGLLKDKNSTKILNILLNHNRIKRIFPIIGSIWNENYIIDSKVTLISETKFSKLVANTNNPSLVFGSFRLYSLVKNYAS